MRRWLPLLLLAVLAVGLFVVSGRLRALHYVPSSASGELVYAAAFSDESDDWSIYDDGRLSARVADGALVVQTDQSSGAAYSAGPFQFGDVIVQARAQASDGPIDNGFGLMVGLRTQDNTRPDDDTYLLFLISSDGYYSVRQRTGGAEQDLSAWIPSSAIQTGLGAANELEVTVSDDQALFTVNGQPLQFCVPNAPGGMSTFYQDDCVDGAMLDALAIGGVATGQIGVVALATATGGPGVTVQFDDILVYGA